MPCKPFSSTLGLRPLDVSSTSPVVTTKNVCPWGVPGKNTGVGCHALPQEILLTPTEPVSPALQVDSLLLSHQGNRKMPLDIPDVPWQWEKGGIVLVENQCPNQSGTLLCLTDTHGNILLTKGSKTALCLEGRAWKFTRVFPSPPALLFEQPWGAHNNNNNNNNKV